MTLGTCVKCVGYDQAPALLSPAKDLTFCTASAVLFLLHRGAWPATAPLCRREFVVGSSAIDPDKPLVVHKSELQTPGAILTSMPKVAGGEDS